MVHFFVMQKRYSVLWTSIYNLSSASWKRQAKFWSYPLDNFLQTSMFTRTHLVLWAIWVW